ncbi:MAG: CHAD domain-containing protein [candidate division KSB1 bacterium]|nr:CHAD domain-containing protein [candidate division KSB1 bacterium]
MGYRKKFRIEGLAQEAPFAKSLKPVLAAHLQRIRKRAEEYLRRPGVEELHDVRIAIRRFRYVLELYANTMKPGRFRRLYEMLVELQNLLGERRDIDVILQKLGERYAQLHLALPEEVKTSWDSEKESLDQSIREKLRDFLTDRRIHKLAR